MEKRWPYRGSGGHRRRKGYTPNRPTVVAVQQTTTTPVGVGVRVRSRQGWKELLALIYRLLSRLLNPFRRLLPPKTV